MCEARFSLSRGIVCLTGLFLILARRSRCRRRRRSSARHGGTRPWKGHKSPWGRVQRNDYHSDRQSYRGGARKMSGPAQNRLTLDRFTHHSDKNMLGEFHNGARHCSARSVVVRKCANAAITPASADAGSAGAMQPPAVEHWSERLDDAYAGRLPLLFPPPTAASRCRATSSRRCSRC